ncbi:MAG: DUF4214 domain-containing protein [Pusillimonas sp.]
MATTTFSFNIDPTISAFDYSHIYFIAFDQAGNAVPINRQQASYENVIKLVENYATQNITTATITQGPNVGSYYPSNYYVVMQSSASSTGDLSWLLSQKANLTPQNALSYDFNFTMVEAVLTPSVFDQIDISALNNFGPNVSIQVNGQPQGIVSSSGFNASLDTLMKHLPAGAVQGADSKPPMILGPNANADLWPTDVWKPYLDDIIANPRVAAGVKSQYFFNANTLNLYQLSTQTAGTTGAPGSSDTQFVLSPLFPGLPGANTNVISMSYSDLQNAIYAPTFGNDADGFAKSYLVSGFDAGLWGANATYTNPNTTHTAVNATTGPATIDLSNSWNWSQLYNYDGAAAKAQGVTSITVDNVLPKATYDQYAGTIAALGNPYGYTFSDLLSVGGVTPAPNIWTGSQDAASIDITVFGNATTPGSSASPPSGFNTSPTGYIVPLSTPGNGWHYQPADVFLGPGQGNMLQIDTRLGGKYHPDANYPMSFRVYAPSSEKAEWDGFITYALATPDASSNPWASWVINSDYTFTNTGSSGLAGFLMIDNLPAAANGDVAWYQLVIGELGSSLQTVYDIYSNNTNGSIGTITTNPGVTVVDIGTGGEKLALAPGLASTYNPLSYFDYNDLKTGVFYQMLLDQPTPAPTDLTKWSTHLANGGDDIDVAKALMTTLAQQQPALTDTDFVGLLYRQGLGRDPQSNELNAWLDQLDGGTSRSEIAVNFANLPEMWANDTIKGVYSAAGGISTVVDWSF